MVSELHPILDFDVQVYDLGISVETDSLETLTNIDEVVSKMENSGYQTLYIQYNTTLEPSGELRVGNLGRRKTKESDYKSLRLYNERNIIPPGFKNSMIAFFFLKENEVIPEWNHDDISEMPTLYINRKDHGLYFEVPDSVYQQNSETWDKLAYDIKDALSK